MHVVAYLPVTHRSSRASFGEEALSSETTKGYVTIPELKYKELKSLSYKCISPFLYQDQIF